MNLKLILKIIFTSIIFLIILVTLSLIINVILLGDLHHKHSFFRPDTDFRVNPGLLINSLFWGVLVSISYLFFGDKIRLKNGFLSGMLYGIVIYIFFIFSQELYYYLFIE
ncbi:MAG TPA: hypothetical protein PK771_09545, partial [Spirochaetota bacterium]|nr:hypothetical protein [Spirochaetota bacterium]